LRREKRRDERKRPEEELGRIVKKVCVRGVAVFVTNSHPDAKGHAFKVRTDRFDETAWPRSVTDGRPGFPP
jgi:hypothetical protein